MAGQHGDWGAQHPYGPKPFVAVAGTPAKNGGDLVANKTVGVPDPEQIVIMATIKGNRVNLIDYLNNL